MIVEKKALLESRIILLDFTQKTWHGGIYELVALKEPNKENSKS